MKKFDCIERPLCRLFSKYGRKVAQHPIPFVVLPVIVAAISCGGFAFMTRETDVEYLFSPENSKARTDQDRLQDEFDSKNLFSPDRSLEQDVIARLIIIPTSGDNLWTQDILDDIFDLDSDIKAFTVKDGSRTINYGDVCIQKDNACFDNGLSLFKNGTQITYPYYEQTIPAHDPVKVFLGQIIGGVTTDSHDVITNVSAMHLSYYLDNTDDSRIWSDAFIDIMLDTNYNLFDIKVWTFYSIENELAKNTERITPYFSVTYTILSTFAVTACTLFDPVRSKPWLGKYITIVFHLQISRDASLSLYSILFYNIHINLVYRFV